MFWFFSHAQKKSLFTHKIFFSISIEKYWWENWWKKIGENMCWGDHSFPYLLSHIKIAIRWHDLYFLTIFPIINTENFCSFFYLFSSNLMWNIRRGWTKIFVKCFTVFSLISLFCNDNKLMPTFVKRSYNFFRLQISKKANEKVLRISAKGSKMDQIKK